MPSWLRGMLWVAVVALGWPTSLARADSNIASGSARVPAPLSLRGAWLATASYDVATAKLPSSARPLIVPSNWAQQGWDHDGVLWMVREVELPASASWRLEFDGVDYSCEVFWDGVRIGGHIGYFAPFAIAVPSASGKHLLAVKVDSPRESSRDWSLHKTLIKGVLGHHDTRPGGAWSVEGQDGNTGGIWGDVRVVAASEAWIDKMRVTTIEATSARAQLRISATITPVQPGPVAVRWQLVAPTGGVAATGSWQGSGVLDITTTVAAPQLWWPRDLGAPALYRLQFRVGQDQQSLRFGIRTIEQDGRRRSLVNGIPVFLRGTNYIGSLYLSTLDRRKAQRDLELMIGANINAIRVHAHVTSPAFYDLADELGLLVWQDFPLQWGYADTASFAQEAARQLHEMLDLLGGHPSVVHWTAQNEAPWSSEWMIYKYPSYDPDQNRHLSTVLADVLASDRSRPSQANSGSAEHAWMGWYSGSYRDFNRPQAHPILTEFGAQALPSLATLRTILRPEQLWPLDSNLTTWEYHNFQKTELVNIAKVAIGTSLEELIANTQAYQSRLVQVAAEGLRRQAWQPVTGIFQFMFVEHWPSMSWGVVDYLRVPKPGWHALRRAYQPVLAMAVSHQKTALRLHVANDRPIAFDVFVVVTREIGRQVAYRRRIESHLRPSSVTAIVEEFAKPAANQSVRIVVTDRRNLILSENFYAPGYFTE